MVRSFSIQYHPNIAWASYNRWTAFGRVFLKQVYFTFVQAIPLVTLIGTLCGMGLTIQSQMGFSVEGGYEGLGKLIVYIVLREFTPLITGVLLVTRSVTALSSELATMKALKEIDALRFMGIDIKSYLINPRILAGSVSLFCMGFLFFISVLLGSWGMVNTEIYLTAQQFFDLISKHIEPRDIFFFIMKSTLSGWLVIHLACHIGLSLKEATYEIPIVANRAVVKGLFLVVTLNIVISAFYFALFGLKL